MTHAKSGAMTAALPVTSNSMPAPSPTRIPKAAARGIAAASTLLAAALPVPALAQAPAALQEIREPDRPAISRPETASPLADPAALTVPVGTAPRVRVAGFRVSGARLVAEEDILATLAPHAGPALGAAELQQAARAVAALYLQRGYLARIAVRSVSVAEGLAHLEVHELRLGKVRIEVAEGARLDPAIAGPFLTARLAPGAPLPLARIQAGVALLDAQPGVEAAVALDPGASDGEVDLVLHLRDRPLWSGRLALDNHGVRELGQERLRLAMQADNAFGMADRSSLRVERSAGSEILLPSFSLALGGTGTRIGVEALAFRYQARRAGLPLGLEGDQQELRFFVSSPLLRASGAAMEGRVGAERIAYRDDSLFGELRRRRLDALQLGVDGATNLAAGRLGFDLRAKTGRADLSGNAGDLAADTATSRAHGRFLRLSWLVEYLQAVGPGSLVLRARGQWADRNLDATQKFFLGGAYRVRAYPQTEATGDAGWLGGIEWRRPLGDGLEGRVFADTGSVRVNAKPWVAQRNRYPLSGLGVGATWQLPDRFRLDTDLARQVGGNAGRNSDGTDSDARTARWRLWLAISRSF